VRPVDRIAWSLERPRRRDDGASTLACGAIVPPTVIPAEAGTQYTGHPGAVTEHAGVWRYRCPERHPGEGRDPVHRASRRRDRARWRVALSLPRTSSRRRPGPSTRHSNGGGDVLRDPARWPATRGVARRSQAKRTPRRAWVPACSLARP